MQRDSLILVSCHRGPYASISMRLMRQRNQKRGARHEGDLSIRPGVGLDHQGEQASAVRIWPVIDNEHAIIIDVEPPPARTFDEVRATGAMI